MEMIEGLVYISDQEKGYTRKKIGRGFAYLDDKGEKITNENTLKRIHDLKIPPMWKDIWICKKAKGHLQVTGKDQKGRKQYLYHALWMKHRNEDKFRRMAEFARALPVIREASLKHMRKRGWPKDKVLGLVVQFLNDYFIRIGNIYYKEQNETYGLTTLRRKHLQIEGKDLCFHYKAKSGKYRKISIKNNQLSRLIKECSELPGHEIFRYQDEDKKWYSVDSHDVNEYLRRITGAQFSSKDFRTWGGTVTAVEKYPDTRIEVSENSRKSLVPTLIKKVAEKLGNTVAICREYYIHPAVLDAVETEKLGAFEKGINRKYPQLKDRLSKEELVALNIIESYEKAVKIEGSLSEPKEKAA